MTVPANLYADKIFAEHPTSLWSLDDTLSGISASNIASKNIAVSKTYGIEAASYGTDIFPGYYLADSATSGSTHINDSGIPMVYGASNITHLYPIENCPSVIFPAFGFLNESGKNREMTFEAWIKVNSNCSIPKRIFGPIASEDGLYVHNGFFTLKVGKYIKSYYAGEWGKPMLIDITYDFREVSLFVNSEQVINMPIDLTEIEFPANISNTGQDQDWVGFYAHDDVTPLSIDCVAIYPYKVSSVIAKKRWIYGQAVPSPDTHSFEDNDVPVIMDYQFSEYGKSYIYPDMGKWIQGSFDNLFFDENDKLKIPEYSLPTIIAKNTITLDEWYSEQNKFYIQESIGTEIVDTLDSNDLYFYMTSELLEDGDLTEDVYSHKYFYFNNFSNIISETVAGVYGVFQSGNAVPSGPVTSINETIFKIQNTDGSNIEAYLYNNNALSETYSLKYDFTDTFGNTTTLHSANVAFNANFVAGLSIPNLLLTNTLSNFFSNPGNLSLMLFGSSSLTNTFKGKIYRFGICNFNNLNKIIDLYTNGYANVSTSSTLLDNYATYTLIPSNTYGSFRLDIATNSFWKDYVPLSYFGKNILDEDMNQFRNLDLLHFTIDYPEPNKYITAIPFINSEIDTSKSLIKSYVYFSNVPETANAIIRADQLTAVPLKYGKTVTPDELDWSEEKYEVVNNTVIYIPDGTDYNNLFLNIFIDFNIYGISANPILLRSLKIGSQSLNKIIENPIGTKLGKKIYPYTLIDNVKDYAIKNPISIYTASTPHLYLTKYSGFRLLGNTFDGTRAVSIKLNESSFDYFKISAIQFSMLSDDIFLEDDTEILRVKTNIPSVYYKIYSSRVSGDTTGKTATLYATDQDDNVLTKDSVLISINGKSSGLDQPTDLIISKDEWNMINIKFVNLIDLGGSTLGSIDFTGPFVINNINSYRINYKNEGDRVFYNNWLEVSTLYASWNYVNDISWSNVSVQVSSTIPGIDPLKIYNTYLGNNRLVVDSSIVPLKTNEYKYSIYQNLTWSTISTQAL